MESVDLLSRVGVPCDVGVDLGLLAEGMFTDVQQDVHRVGGLQEIPDLGPAHDVTSLVRWKNRDGEVGPGPLIPGPCFSFRCLWGSRSLTCEQMFPFVRRSNP